MSYDLMSFICAGTVEGEIINLDGSVQKFGPEPNMVVFDSAYALAWIIKKAIIPEKVDFYIALGDLGNTDPLVITPTLENLLLDDLATVPPRPTYARKALSQDQFHLYNELSGNGNSRVVARSVAYSLVDVVNDPPEFTVASVIKDGTTITNKLTITATFVEQATGVIRECGLFVGPGANLTPAAVDIANHCENKGGIMISRKIITPGVLPLQKATQSTLNIRWKIFISSPEVPS